MAQLRDDYLAFLDERGAGASDRDSGREHLTSSCFVFTPDLSRILLCFHRKGRFWVQLGGHIDSTDPSVSAAAFREAVEEGGIVVDPLSERPVDVDRHALTAGFGRCAVHWDVGFAAVAPLGSVPVVSDESDDVRWWPVNALPSDVPDGFGDRVRRVIGAVSARP
jgi:8-oxo-dGTP pyrophosphatase MutT (NUDIX family)